MDSTKSKNYINAKAAREDWNQGQDKVTTKQFCLHLLQSGPAGRCIFLATHIRPIIDAKQRPWGIFFLCSSLHGLMGVIAWKIVLKLNFSHIPCIWELNALKWTFWMVVCLQELTGILFFFVETRECCYVYLLMFRWHTGTHLSLRTILQPSLEQALVTSVFPSPTG